MKIELRAWDKKEKKMRYLDKIGVCYEYSKLTFDADDEFNALCSWPSGEDTDIDNQEITVWTGLKDSTGRKIFEGDIVRVTFGGEGGRDYLVAYMSDEDYPAFELVGWDGESNGLSEVKAIGGIEIVGNRFENENLLAGVKQ